MTRLICTAVRADPEAAATLEKGLNMEAEDAEVLL